MIMLCEARAARAPPQVPETARSPQSVRVPLAFALIIVDPPGWSAGARSILHRSADPGRSGSSCGRGVSWTL